MAQMLLLYACVGKGPRGKDSMLALDRLAVDSSSWCRCKVPGLFLESIVLINSLSLIVFSIYFDEMLLIGILGN
jgi:hypothetical protein